MHREILLRIYSREELPVCELIDLTRGIISAAFYHRGKKNSLRDRCVFSANIVHNCAMVAELYYGAYNDNRTIQTSCR